MVSWEAYVDESCDKKTVFCVGGWLAQIDTWKYIDSRWTKAIASENKFSAKYGFPSIARYHATDCANLKNEFDESKGWTIDRQIALSKKLCSILESRGPFAVVSGGIIADLIQHWPELRSEADYKRPLYYLSFITVMLGISQWMLLNAPNDRVSIFYDQSKDLGPVAEIAYRQFMEDPSMSDLAGCFLTCAPMRWQDCILLQPADLIAYEGMRRIRDRKNGKKQLRKALQAMLGKRTPIAIGYYEDRAYEHLKKMLQRQPSLGVI